MASNTRRSGSSYGKSTENLPDLPIVNEMPDRYDRAASTSRNLDELLAQENSVWGEGQHLLPVSNSAAASKDWRRVSWHRNGPTSTSVSSVSSGCKRPDIESIPSLAENETPPTHHVSDHWDQSSMLRGAGSGFRATVQPSREEVSEADRVTQAELELAMEVSRVEAQQALRREEADIQAALDLSKLDASDATVGASRDYLRHSQRQGRLSQRDGRVFVGTSSVDDEADLIRKVLESSRFEM